jgi:hypothetical protein
MVDIIAPIDREVLKNELTPEKLIRPTNKGHNQIYIVTAHDSPQTMREIGRLRELSFRSSGGGTGNELDVDEFDYMDNPYRQLIVWDPMHEEILGGYRFLHGKDMAFDSKGQPNIVTSHMFHFSEVFIRNYLPYTIDLGRAFVQPDYQSSRMGAKSLFALDNLWDGIGTLTVIFPETKYLIGKVTMYPSFDEKAREMILYFMYRYFPDNDSLLIAKEPVSFSSEKAELDAYFNSTDFKENYKKLNTAVRERGHNIPPLINAYISLSPTMKTFGTGINHEFADIFDTGIMITIADIFEEKKKRYIEPYLEYRQQLFGPVL